MTDTVTIYGLKDRNTGDIFYVGQTTNPEQRLRAHTIPSDNEPPEMVTLELVSPDSADISERQWIHYGVAQGWPLSNRDGNGKAATPFGEWLVDESGKRGWSHNELARQANLSSAMISLVINGHKNPGIDFCSGIANALSIPHEDVFRKAGLLPPAREPNAKQRKLLAILDSLTDDAIDTLLNVANALLIREQVRADKQGHNGGGK